MIREKERVGDEPDMAPKAPDGEFSFYFCYAVAVHWILPFTSFPLPSHSIPHRRHRFTGISQPIEAVRIRVEVRIVHEIVGGDGGDGAGWDMGCAGAEGVGGEGFAADCYLGVVSVDV